TASPIASPPAAAATAAPTTTTTSTPTATASGGSSDLADRIHQKLEKKFRGHHGITIDTGDKDEDADLRKMRDFVAIPIVAIVFLSIFGAPVVIVIMIGMFTLLVSPMRQRTIGMMVGEGHAILAELIVRSSRSLRERCGVG